MPNQIVAMAAGFALLAATIFVAPLAAAQQKPNVVFILADNVGYGDMGPMAAASCGACPPRASISLPSRGFV